MRLAAILSLLVLCGAGSAQVHIQPNPPSINLAPVFAVTANGQSISNGGSIAIPYNTSVASMNWQIVCSDPDGDYFNVGCSLPGGAGLASSEWIHGNAAGPYTLTPTTGNFADPAGRSWQIGLIGLDTAGKRRDFYFNINQAADSAPDFSATSNGTAVSDGETLYVAYGDSLASLGLQFELDDADGDMVAVSAAISNVGNTGLVQSEFESGQQAVPLYLAPTSGSFNTPQGVTHQITLTAQSGTLQSSFSIYIAQSPAPADAEFSESGSPISYNALAAGTSRDLGAVDVANMPSATLWITVTNTGWQNLTLGTPALTGNGAAQFVVDLSGYLSTLTPGSSTQFGVSYDAAMIGTDAAWVELAHDGVTHPTPFRFEVMATATSANVPVIATASAPAGMANVAYAPYALPVTGGTGLLNFAVVGGMLPPGIALSTGGELSGTPTLMGTSQFTVQVTDSVGASSSQQLSMEVQIDPSLVLSSNGGGGDSSGCTASSGVSMLWLGLLALLLTPAIIRWRTA